MHVQPTALAGAPGSRSNTPESNGVAFERVRRLLLSERDELVESKEECERVLEDDGVPERAEATSREDYEAVLRRHEDAINAVDLALGSIDDGTYGLCNTCGGTIALERLEAIPSAVTCVGCQGGNQAGPRRFR